jgi:hypothetical protein
MSKRRSNEPTTIEAVGSALCLGLWALALIAIVVRLIESALTHATR